MTNKYLIGAALAGGIAWAGLGSPSVASAQVYIELESAPPRIEEYPTTYYEGRPDYWYDGHWYYRSGPRWAYYREEPRPLSCIASHRTGVATTTIVTIVIIATIVRRPRRVITIAVHHHRRIITTHTITTTGPNGLEYAQPLTTTSSSISVSAA